MFKISILSMILFFGFFELTYSMDHSEYASSTSQNDFYSTMQAISEESSELNGLIISLFVNENYEKSQQELLTKAHSLQSKIKIIKKIIKSITHRSLYSQDNEMYLSYVMPLRDAFINVLNDLYDDIEIDLIDNIPTNEESLYAYAEALNNLNVKFFKLQCVTCAEKNLNSSFYDKNLGVIKKYLIKCKNYYHAKSILGQSVHLIASPINIFFKIFDEMANKSNFANLALTFVNPTRTTKKVLPIIEGSKVARKALSFVGLRAEMQDIERAIDNNAAPTKIMKNVERNVHPAIKPAIIATLNHGTVLNATLYVLNKVLYPLRATTQFVDNKAQSLIQKEDQSTALKDKVMEGSPKRPKVKKITLPSRDELLHESSDEENRYAHYSYEDLLAKREKLTKSKRRNEKEQRLLGNSLRNTEELLEKYENEIAEIIKKMREFGSVRNNGALIGSFDEQKKLQEYRLLTSRYQEIVQKKEQLREKARTPYKDLSELEQDGKAIEKKIAQCETLIENCEAIIQKNDRLFRTYSRDDSGYLYIKNVVKQNVAEFCQLLKKCREKLLITTRDQEDLLFYTWFLKKMKPFSDEIETQKEQQNNQLLECTDLIAQSELALGLRQKTLNDFDLSFKKSFVSRARMKNNIYFNFWHMYQYLAYNIQRGFLSSNLKKEQSVIDNVRQNFDQLVQNKLDSNNQPTFKAYSMIRSNRNLQKLNNSMQSPLFSRLVDGFLESRSGAQEVGLNLAEGPSISGSESSE